MELKDAYNQMDEVSLINAYYKRIRKLRLVKNQEELNAVAKEVITKIGREKIIRILSEN